MQNLILGIIDNYKFEQISNFLFSLKSVSGNEHPCLFAGPGMGAATVRRIEKLGVEVIRYKKDFPFIPKPHPDNFKSLPQKIHIYNFRHFLYYDYLLKNGDKFQHVLLTDVKDVFFQRNPFDFGMKHSLHVAVENTAIPIKDCECTSKWIRRGYGMTVLDEMKEKEVICAGTTLAPTAIMKAYLQRLIREFAAVKNVFNCADQALHNVLIYRNEIGPVVKCYNFKGPILTVGTERNYLLNQQGELINENGDVVPIVHQYDRHEELVRLLQAKSSEPARPRNYFQAIKNLFLRPSSVL